MSSTGLIAAFAAGILSFLSPCVLPLIPGYLSFMTGLTTAELASDQRPRAQILAASLLFVTGFSLVFIGLGASASVLGQFLDQYQTIIARIFGLLVIGFGVLMLGIIKVPWLYGEARADLARTRRFGRGAAFAMGIAFAAGWTPCVGPILGTILGLASSYDSAARGALLLLAYSAGLALPFIAVALAFGSAKPLLSWLSRHAVVINRIAGVVLIFIGLLLVSGQLESLTGWLARTFPGLLA